MALLHQFLGGLRQKPSDTSDQAAALRRLDAQEARLRRIDTEVATRQRGDR